MSSTTPPAAGVTVGAATKATGAGTRGAGLNAVFTIGFGVGLKINLNADLAGALRALTGDFFAADFPAEFDGTRFTALTADLSGAFFAGLAAALRVGAFTPTFVVPGFTADFTAGLAESFLAGDMAKEGAKAAKGSG